MMEMVNMFGSFMLAMVAALFTVTFVAAGAIWGYILWFDVRHKSLAKLRERLKHEINLPMRHAIDYSHKTRIAVLRVDKEIEEVNLHIERIRAISGGEVWTAPYYLRQGKSFIFVRMAA